MRSRIWATMAGLTIFALLAVACAAYLLAARQLDVTFVAGALAALAIGQFAMVLLAWPRLSGLEARLAEDGKRMRDLADKVAASDAHFHRLDQQAAEGSNRNSSAILEEVRVLRDSLSALARDIARPAAAKPAPQPGPPPEPAAARASEAPRQSAPPRDHLELLLEPVIELNSGTTMHYRPQLAMVGEGAASVDHAALMEKAEAGGVRAALELHMLKMSLPVLRRLRLRHPNMRLFVPLGASVLNATGDLDRVIAALEIEHDVAPGVVFDLLQSDLGRLQPEGIEGLARLGRAGAVMALSEVSIGGLDLASLRQLGVRYLAMDAASFDAGFGTSPAWKQFAQFARAMQFQLIACRVATPQQATAATRVARFGYGPFFAPPRRVKSDAGQQAPAWSERAA